MTNETHLKQAHCVQTEGNISSGLSQTLAAGEEHMLMLIGVLTVCMGV